MKKKKLILFFIFFIFININTGCEKKTKEKESLNSLAENGLEKVEAPQGCEVISDSDKFIAVSDDQSYHFETDDSGFSTSYGLANAGTSMFYMDIGYLYYYDNNNNQFGLLCNKPDCSHYMEDADTCNANIVSAQGLSYSEGALYTAVYSDTIELLRINPDTMEREIVGNLCIVPKDKVTMGENSLYFLRWVIHRGYIYYYYELHSGLTEDVYYLNGSNCIYRMPLDGSNEPECILPLVCEATPYDTDIQCSGSYVYMNLSEKDKAGAYLYRYNIEAGKVEKLEALGNDIWNYTVEGSKVWYSNKSEPDKVYCYDAITEDVKVLILAENEKYQYLGCGWIDDDYIYVGYDMKEESDDSTGGMIAFDRQGKIVADIPWMFSNDEYFIMDFFCGIYDRRLYFLRDIGGEENPWISIQDAYKMPYYIEIEDLADGEYEIREAEK